MGIHGVAEQAAVVEQQLRQGDESNDQLLASLSQSLTAVEQELTAFFTAVEREGDQPATEPCLPEYCLLQLKQVKEQIEQYDTAAIDQLVILLSEAEPGGYENSYNRWRSS